MASTSVHQRATRARLHLLLSETGEALRDHPRVGLGSDKKEIRASELSFATIAALHAKAMLMNDALRHIDQLTTESAMLVGSVDAIGGLVIEALCKAQVDLDIARAA